MAGRDKSAGQSLGSVRDKESVMSLPSCCQYHGFDECGCRQGHDCPERMPSPEDAAGWLVWLVVSMVSLVSAGVIAALIASLP
jgi:hypothetical protein